MNRLQLILVSVILMLFGTEQSFSITKDEGVLHLLEFYGGYSVPHGTYDQIGRIIFNDGFGGLRETDADEYLFQTFTFGLNYGQLRGKYWVVSFGFRFTEIRADSQVPFVLVGLRDTEFRQFDLELNVNYSPLNIQRNRFSPYVGLGIGAGFLITDRRGFRSESDATAVARVNFGFDFKLFSSESRRSFVTMSSVNSWELVSVNDRPKYLNIGGALKYWFRL